MLTDEQIEEFCQTESGFFKICRAVERATAERCAEIAGIQDAIGKTPKQVADAIRNEYGIKD